MRARLRRRTAMGRIRAGRLSLASAVLLRTRGQRGHLNVPAARRTIGLPRRAYRSQDLRLLGDLRTLRRVGRRGPSPVKRALNTVLSTGGLGMLPGPQAAGRRLPVHLREPLGGARLALLDRPQVLEDPGRRRIAVARLPRQAAIHGRVPGFGQADPGLRGLRTAVVG